MGNLLCKDKMNRTKDKRSPIDRAIGRCSDMCPSTIGKKKHFWDKQVLETSPPLQTTQPKSNNVSSNGWTTIALNVPEDSSPPVAPPRKKRPSMLNKDGRPNKISNKDSNSVDTIPSAISLESTDKIIAKKDTAVGSDTPIKTDVFLGKDPTSEKGIISENIFQDVVSEKDATSEKIHNLQNEELTLRDPLENKSAIPEDAKNRDTLPPNTVDDKKVVTVTRKVSKVGNRKSDKFFGENLSDCLSDKAVEPESKTDDAKISAESSDLKDNVKVEPSQESVDSKDEIRDNDSEKTLVFDPEYDYDSEIAERIRKEQGNMIFALSYQVNRVNEPDETDRKPVEEALIVPIRRGSRHICDDDDAIGSHLHRTPSPSDLVAPKKPQRDFTKYRKSLENLNLEQDKDHPHSDTFSKSSSESPQPRPSRRHKPTPTEERQQNPNLDLLPDRITVPEPVEDRILDSPPKLQMSDSEKLLRRSLSSQPFLTADLIEKIAEQANTLALSQTYLPEHDHIISNDGSGLVSPSFKLEQRKPLSRQSSRCDQVLESDKTASASKEKLAVEIKECASPVSTPLPGPEDEKLLLPTIPAIQTENVELPKEKLFVEIKESVSPVGLATPDPQNSSPSKSPTVERIRAPFTARSLSSNDDIATAAKAFLDSHDLQPEEVLRLLEDEFGELLHSKLLPAEDRLLIDELRKTIDKRSQNQPPEKASNETKLVEDFIANEKIHLANDHQHPNPKPHSHHSVGKSLKNKILDDIKSNEKRRHSIEELNSWFSSDIGVGDVAGITNTNKQPGSPPETADELKIELSSKTLPETSVGNDSDHSPLLKYLDVDKVNKTSDKN